MSLLGTRLLRGLTHNYAASSIAERDPRLRGRTYAIPFEQVWQAARALASGGLRRWRLIDSDDYEGVIHAEARSLVFRSVADVEINITLDQDGQTRVDVRSQSRKRGGDLGRNARRIGKFFRTLDQRLYAPRPATSGR